ncbi:MAG: hypothetical protein ABSB96_03450 [Gaiellaceae bacterium]
MKPRLALAAVFLALLALYYSISELLPNLSEPGDVVWVDFALSALIFAPIYLALGLRNRLSAVIGAIVAALLAAVLYLSGETLAASIPKLAAAALVGFIFLRFCEKLWLLVAIALLAPVMDTISVWRGPTNRILTTAPQVFDAFSVASPIPGERAITLSWDAPRDLQIAGYLVYRRRDGGGERQLTKKPFCSPKDACGRSIDFTNFAQPADARAVYRLVIVDARGRTAEATVNVPPAGHGKARSSARPGPLAPTNLSAETAPASVGLGLSDIIFFALFLAGAMRFRLRPVATWLALVASIGVTSILADYEDFFGLKGFPAIPGLSLAFLLANGDLIWRRLRNREEIDDDFEPRPVPLPRR